MTRAFLSLSFLAMLAACGSEPIVRYPVPSVESGETRRIAFRSVEIRDVTLPRYASEEEIMTEVEGGGITSTDKLIWADDPARAITLELARHIGIISGAQVASEPWPFDTFPETRVEVRAEEMLAGLDGQFRFSGQYFVAPLNGRPGRSGRFVLSAPYDAAAGVASISAARAAVVLDLARLIARDGLR